MTDDLKTQTGREVARTLMDLRPGSVLVVNDWAKFRISVTADGSADIEITGCTILNGGPAVLMPQEQRDVVEYAAERFTGGKGIPPEPTENQFCIPSAALDERDRAVRDGARKEGK